MLRRGRPCVCPKSIRHGSRGQTLIPLFYILKHKTVSFRVVGVFRALNQESATISEICGKQNPSCGFGHPQGVSPTANEICRILICEDL